MVAARDLFDVALPLFSMSTLSCVDVEADDLVADFAIAQHERQADIAQADDADGRRISVELGYQFRVHSKRP